MFPDSRAGTKEVLCHRRCVLCSPLAMQRSLVPRGRGGVSPMRIGLDARVVSHHSQTRVMLRHAVPTAAWKATTAATRWVAARIESRRRGPGPQACGA